MKRIILFALGFALVVGGMSLLLRNWQATAIIFNGAMPPVLAVGGLVLMFAASLKK